MQSFFFGEMNRNYVDWQEFQRIIRENCIIQYQQKIEGDLYFGQYKSFFENTLMGTGCMITYSLRPGLSFFYTRFEFDNDIRIENEYLDDCIAFYFSLGGKAKVIDDDSERGTLSKGSFCFYKTDKGMSYLDLIPTDEPYEVIGLHFSLEAFKNFLGDRISSLPQFMIDSMKSSGNIYRIQSMEEEIYLRIKSYDFDVNEDLSHQLFLESRTYELISYAIGQFTRTLTNVPLSKTEESVIDKACNRLKSDILKPPSLEDLAGFTEVSALQLTRLFKRKFGQTPHGFLKDLRLLEAKRLLESGKENVNGAAFKVGYDSVSSFSRAFVKKFGSRPGHFMPR